LLQEGLYPLDLMLSNPQSTRMFNIKGSTLGSKICHLEPRPKYLLLFEHLQATKASTPSPPPPWILASLIHLTSLLVRGPPLSHSLYPSPINTRFANMKFITIATSTALLLSARYHANSLSVQPNPASKLHHQPNLSPTSLPTSALFRPKTYSRRQNCVLNAASAAISAERPFSDESSTDSLEINYGPGK
jgi:hypothetical protein